MATVMVETQAYGLPQPPVGGTATYSVSPGSVAPNSCDAITPCQLKLTQSSVSGTATLSVTDIVTPPAGAKADRPRWTSSANVTLTCSTKVNFNFASTGPDCPGSSSDLMVTVIGDGTVTGTGGTGSNINCSNPPTASGACTATYASGSLATLTATPATGFVFEQWTNCTSGSFLCTLTVRGAPAVIATFKPMGNPL